jgi:hypothetical protein
MDVRSSLFALGLFLVGVVSGALVFGGDSASPSTAPLVPVTTEPSPRTETTDAVETAAILEAVDALSRELNSERRVIGGAADDLAMADDVVRELESLRTAVEALATLTVQSASGVAAAAPMFQAGDQAWSRFVERHAELDRARAASLLTEVIAAGERDGQYVSPALRHWGLGIDQVVGVFGAPRECERERGDYLSLDYRFEPPLDLPSPLDEAVEGACFVFDVQGRLTDLELH